MSSQNRTIQEALSAIERSQRLKRISWLLGLAVVVALTYGGLQVLNFSLEMLARQQDNFFAAIADFVPPNFVELSLYSKTNEVEGLGGVLQTLTHPGTFAETFTTEAGRNGTILGLSFITIVIGFTGTVLGFPLALVFGILGSERVVPFPFNFVFRGTMSTIRAIPALVWILIYIPLAGITPLSAMLAVATDTIGNLGRLFTDELEEIDEGPIEAISSTGADRPQIISFGMLSQVSTSFVAWTLYILEINTRIAISLGVYGAGGIGQYIDTRIALGAYDRGAAGIAMVIFIVLTVELLSSRIRARLRPGEHEGKGFVDSLRDLGNPKKWLGVGDTTKDSKN
ncbi:PhnE/PtxC family ABC transporter permease [Halomarina oriensis]|uniref:Phosphate/phosphonate ABC transporter permease n=1 Tax=Halomarina oriensis TaxID=671145 RepID=A0A6B0GL98_9EURY|nr:phosphate/phosphonate ABC transporter permease [Halomarina oriensis]MWG34661.1 phosphate/phosphonate ABC transporter permease [Halomarina oriensis]